VKNSSIGIIDSGIGGASILKEIIKILPNEKYVYLVDNKNMPYGRKSKNKIRGMIQANAVFLLERYHIKMLVIACNTASSVCSSLLRKKFLIPIICVEPPIKPAIERGYKKILLMATRRTLKSNLTIKEIIKEVKARNKNTQDKIIITKLEIKNLANEIDKNFKNFDLLNDLLAKTLYLNIKY
jgi:glutamate racemase